MYCFEENGSIVDVVPYKVWLFGESANGGFTVLDAHTQVSFITI